MSPTPSILLAPILFAFATSAMSQPTPIHQSDIPFTITKSGDYVLAHDIRSPADNPVAITIAASDVTLDLDIHTITGPGIGATQAAYAITAAPDMVTDRLTIRNGTIRDFPTGAVSLSQSHEVRIANLLVHDIGEIGIDIGDEGLIRDNILRDIRIDDTTRTGTVIAIRGGLNTTIENNTITSMHHAGNGQLDAIRVDRGCYVVQNHIEGITTAPSGTGDVVAIACATMAADIRANTVNNIANRRPGGIAIGIRIGSGSAERNRVTEVAAASLPIGIQGIAAVFIERNEVDGVRAINNGPDAYGIWAAGTGGRVISNTIHNIDCAGDTPRNREVGLRVNSSFEVSGNTIHLPNLRTHARQSGIEVSGQYNVIVENIIRLGQPDDSPESLPPGTSILLGPFTRSNTIGGNEINGRIIDQGIDNRAPSSPGNLPAI